jgi:YHS domain-containing protein
MNRYANALILTACFLFSHSSLIFAAQFFERNGLAIDGHDPVAYFTEQKPVKGSPAFRVEFEGATFQFASAAHRDSFVADPSKFVPQYGGYCAYGMARGYKAKIDPAAFTVVSNKLYLNYSDAVRSRWLADVPGYIQKADANWPEVQKSIKVQE